MTNNAFYLLGCRFPGRPAEGEKWEDICAGYLILGQCGALFSNITMYCLQAFPPLKGGVRAFEPGGRSADKTSGDL
jgi:hypothetical protein